jgi:hypothetical protein
MFWKNVDILRLDLILLMVYKVNYFGLYVFRQKLLKGIETWFLAMYFKSRDYNEDDLGAPSNVISVREIIR